MHNKWKFHDVGESCKQVRFGNGIKHGWTGTEETVGTSKQQVLVTLLDVRSRCGLLTIIHSTEGIQTSPERHLNNVFKQKKNL